MSARSRDAALDVLRGFFMAIVAVDHAAWFPSIFEVVTGRGRLFSSAAERFMLISGFLVGQVRGREPVALAARKMWRRALTLVVWTAGLTLALHVTATLSGYAPRDVGDLSTAGPVGVVVGALTLRYVYGHQHFLALYAMFLAGAPLVLWALARKQTAWVLALSLSVWLLGLVTPGEPSWTGHEESELSWQVLFVLGLVGGVHAAALRVWLARRPWLYGAAIAASLVTLALSWLWIGEKSVWLGRLFKRDEIGPGRLVVGILWTVTLYAVVKRHESAVLRAVGGFFAPLGRHPLYLFIVLAPMTYLLCGHAVPNLVAASLVDAALLLVVWLMVRHRVLFSVIPS